MTGRHVFAKMCFFVSTNSDSDTVIYVLIQEWCTITNMFFICLFFMSFYCRDHT